jgi:hypothetical protein
VLEKSSLTPLHECSAELNKVFQDIWKRLELAPATRTEAWRLLTLGTWDGVTPQLRTVVLRSAKPELRELWIYTDRRASKVPQIQQHPHVSALFYDPVQQIQIRLTGDAYVESDPAITNSLWSALHPGSQKMYCAPYAPGTALDTPTVNLPEELKTRDPLPEESAVGRANFAPVRIVIQHLDWVYLKPEGHLRALFEFKQQQWQATWAAT